ncbi:MAG: amidohydrolase family protein [Ilumatobacter sp.]|uniref:amidohydrolase family protein n=1 Tax=Ilumatobacter sp. TaxID=1967498 RepID=UPI003297DB8E
MPYAHRPHVLDADSHLMEGLTWLRDHADPSVRELLPDLTPALDKGGVGAASKIAQGLARIGDVDRADELAEDVIASAKGWMALGAMDPAERTRALDLLGFGSQLVFSTFSVGLFAFAQDPDVVYGGTRAHNRMMTEFCNGDDRLVSVGFLPLDDPDRTLAAVDEALEMGCGALWLAHATSAGRSPAHVDNDPVWAAIQDAGIPIVMHVGGGKSSVSKGWHDNGLPRPKDLHGGGENLRAKDLPSVHHAAETWLSVMILDGVFDRFPGLRCGVIEMGASWAPSLMSRLDYAAKSFSRTEPRIAELSMKPSDFIRRQIRFTPFPGEDVAQMIAHSGPELYLFSSDYPHPEGTKDPIGKFEKSFDACDVDQAARQMFYEDNYRTLLGA